MSSHSVRAQQAARLLLVAAALLATVLGGAAQAGAVDNGTVGIRPASESDFFHLSLYPGAATDATAVVSNHTAAEVTLLTYPVDGVSTPQGGFGLAAQHDPQQGVGAWAQSSVDRVTVPAHSEVNVGFRLTVPVGTPPGDYAGGVIIQSPEQAGKPVTVGDQTAVQLNVIQRQGVRVYLHVDGTATRTLATGPLTAHHTGNTVAFDLTLNNTGNTTLHPTAALDLNSSIGANTKLQFPAPEMLLPGASITLHTALAQAPLIEYGHAEATVHSEAGTGFAHTSLVYAPPALIAGTILLLALLLLAAWRTTRFLRRARQALAAQAADSTPAGRRADGSRAAAPARLRPVNTRITSKIDEP